MLKKVCCIILLPLVLSACSIYGINSEELTEKFYPSKSPNDVVFIEQLTQPHEVIATVVVSAERRQHMDEVIQKMKREAAVLGGDAITDISIQSGNFWKKLPPQKLLGNAYIRAVYSAKIVALMNQPEIVSE